MGLLFGAIKHNAKHSLPWNLFEQFVNHGIFCLACPDNQQRGISSRS